MNIRSVVKLCLAALLVLVVLWTQQHWKTWENEKEVYKLLSILVLAIGGGLFVVMVLLPKLGDAVGEAMYSSGEASTASEGMKAAAKMAKGDYQGAIAEYEVMIKERPADSFPVSEIAKIHADKLGDPAKALAFLREHLAAREWAPDDAAFLNFRIVDLHVGLREFDKAKQILQQVAGDFPGTRHSANAKHKISELDQKQFKEIQARRSQGGSAA
jgi:hypothetical protein